MRQALRRAGPAVFASAPRSSWRCCACRWPQVNGTSGLGPIGAMGVALAMLSMLTLLPAALVVGGRRAFWPFMPRFGSEGTDETHGFWRRVGERVAATPRRVWITTALLLGLGCLGLTSFSTGLTNTQDFRGRGAVRRGPAADRQGLPGRSQRAHRRCRARRRRAVLRVQRALRSVPGVAAVGAAELGRPGARFSADRSSRIHTRPRPRPVPRLRAAARAASPTALVGGPTAQQKDFDVAAAHDNRLIVPIVLLLVFLILVLLLRAVTLPLLLIATVILSFGAALGHLGRDLRPPLRLSGRALDAAALAFIFLVALGVDYNIFLMARAREETLRHGARDGMLRGLAVTGGVITSAGIVLAGTFTMLADAAAQDAHRARLHDRLRRPARHLHRALRPRARARLRRRPARLVAERPRPKEKRVPARRSRLRAAHRRAPPRTAGGVAASDPPDGPN